MELAYHYMPLKHYQKLRKNNSHLVPKTPIVHNLINRIFRLGINSNEKYLFCLLGSSKPTSWVESGWLDNLKERHSNGYAVVSFKIKKGKAHILDAGGLYNLTDQLGMTPKKKNHPLLLIGKMIINYRELRKTLKQYLNTKIPLKEYKGDYQIPELIFADRVPFADLTLEEICS